MAQGKSKKNYGKKGQKKKVVDALSRKEWFELKAPAPFQSESFGYTCANRTQGLSTSPSIQKKSKIVSRAESSLKCKQILLPTKTASTGERSSSSLIRPKEDKLLPASMVSTPPEIKSVPSSRREKPSLKLSLMSNPKTDIS